MILGAPLILVLASIGGVLAWAIRRRRAGSTWVGMVFLMAWPIIALPIESLLPAETQIRRVHSQIDIDAPAEIVWQNITDLDPIGPHPAIFNLLGIPRPLRADMACE